MKTQHLVGSSILRTTIGLLVATAAACASSPPSTTGPGGGTGNGGSSGGPTVTLDATNLLSDFDDPAAATIVRSGTPQRNGYWYTYNDASTTCMQMPGNGAAYVGEAPTTPSPKSGGLALHAQWNTCSTWGAGVGADLNQPIVDGGMYTGAKVPYDIGAFKGITFYAMTTAAGDGKLRIKIPMTDETKTTDGGNCVDSPTNKCSDDWGYLFTLPTDGAWHQVTVDFTDTKTFKQEGWGAIFKWTPADVTSIQIQSQDKGEAYDFWIDDMYLY
jgi:hypothetical protein